VRPALLVLEDGTVFRGVGFGADGESFGEVVFNTALTGYQEVLTDPSYRGQIVVMTAPEMGNVGVNAEDAEAKQPACAGFVVRALSPVVSSWRAERPLARYLEEHGLVGVADVDTRALTRRLRTAGAQRGAVSTVTLDADALLERVRASQGLEGRDLVREVTTREIYTWDEPTWLPPGERRDVPPADLHVVAYDYGIKRNILQMLRDLGCRTTVLPAATPAAEALALGGDGYFLSNGPGDPAAVPYAAEAARELVASGKPVFGICLGHQILGLALGGRTYKLRFGHHGANHPVKDLATGKVEITAQNHGFAVDVESLAGKAELTHVNLNDSTVEGMRLADRPVFSVQYHPEASPGPHDAAYLFRRFVSLMKG
jgi:carbamoyl-phosphate synthase small subunit